MGEQTNTASADHRAQRSRWHQRLSTRLALLGALAVGAAVACSLWVLVAQAESALLDQRQALERVEAERVAGLLNERVGQTLGLLKQASQHLPGALADNPAQLQAALAQRPLLLAAFDSVFVAGTDGRLRLLHDERGFRSSEVRVNDRDYFRAVMATGAPALSAPVMGRVSGEPIVVFAVPLQQYGRTLGVLGGSVRLGTHALLSGLSHSAEPQGFGDTHATSALVVTDALGHIVWHRDPTLIGRPINHEPRLLAPQAAWARDGGSVRAEASVHAEGDTMTTHAGLPVARWLVWRLLPRSEIVAPLVQGRWRAVQAGAVITLGLTLCLWAWMWWLFKPLRQLQARSMRLFDADIDPAAGWPQAAGEVGELARALQHALHGKLALDARANAISSQLSSVLQAAPTPILLTRQRKFELVSPAASRLLGRSAGELVGQPASIIYASNQAYEQLGSQVARAFGQQQEFSTDMQFLRGDGQLFWGHLVGRPVHWDDASAGTLWTLSDITAERSEREALQWSANHDPLTGLANRAALARQLEAHVGQAGSDPCALLLLDLDRFKPINDLHGHAAGDAVLRAISQTLLGVVRGGDLVARLGGDEFAVLLPSYAGEAAMRVAEAICSAVGHLRVDWQGASLGVGISVGVALRHADLADVSEWMAAADAACYAAKAAGRGRAHLAQDGAVPVALRLVKA